ncbi:hypothetical protein [Vibrio parahaemolyticus]|uniref:hypothetical protein n=1 Tax=Vibrio parahaemolyticus TaxID=670 RepID=UPI0035C0C741|nr:hypothetical protein [Vibrio parahaemolyticus]
MSKKQTGKSTLLHLAFLGLLWLALLNPAYAFTPSSCPEAFDSQGQVIKSGAICDEDVLMNSINMITGGFASKHSAVAEVYESFGVNPIQFSGSTDTFLGMLPTINTAIYTFFLYVFFALMIIVGAIRVFDIMVYGSFSREGGGLVLDVLWLFFAGVFFWYVDDTSSGTVYTVTVGQLVLLKIVLFATSFANYLVSIVIVETSGDKITHSAQPWQTKEFESVSKVWAGNLVSSVGAMQENARLVNYYSVATSEASMIKNDYVSDGSFWGAVSSSISELMAKIVPYDTRDPSVSEVYQGLFEDSSINVVMTSQRPSRDITRTTFELSDDAVIDGKISSPLFERSIRVRDMFSASNVATISAGVPDEIDPAIVRNIAKSGGIQRIFEKLFIQTTTDEEQIREDSKIGGQMIHDLIQSQMEQYPNANEEMIASVIANFLLGSASIQESAKVGGTITALAVQPFTDVNRLSEMRSTEVLYPLLSQSMIATREYSKYLCYKNIEKAAWEFDLASRWIEGGRDLDADFDRYSDVPYPYAICTQPDGEGGFTFLTDNEDTKDLLEVANVTRESGRSVPLSSHLEQIKSKFDAKRDSALKSAETEVQVLADYRSRVSASMRWALLEYKRNSQSEYQKELARNQRVKGAAAAIDILKGSMSSLGRYQRAFDWKSSVSVSNHAMDDGYLPRRPLDEEYHSVRIGQVGEYSTAWDLLRSSRANFGSSDELSRGLEDDSVAVSESTFMEGMARNLAEMVIVGEDTMKYGLGLDESKTLGDNMIECSTVRNCTNIRIPPLQMWQMIGIEMVTGAIKIYIVDILLQKLDSVVNGAESTSGKGDKGDGGIFSKVNGLFSDFGIDLLRNLPLAKGAGFVTKLATTVSGMWVIFAHSMNLAGNAAAIVFPVMVTLGFLKLNLNAILSFAMAFFTLPIVLVLSLIKFDDQHSIIKRSQVFKNMFGVGINIPLNTFAAVLFMVLSYVSSYMSLSIADGALAGYRGADAGGFMGSLYVEMMSPFVLMGVQYLSLKYTLKLSENVPAMTLKEIGVNIESNDGSSMGQVFSAAALTSPLYNLKAAFTKGNSWEAMKKRRDEIRESRINPPSAASRKGSDEPKSGNTPSSSETKNDAGNSKPSNKERKVENDSAPVKAETKRGQGDNPDSTTESREEK